jgi:hypothetical protein
MLLLEGGRPIAGRTADLSVDGVSVTFSDPLPVGQSGQVVFDIFVDDKLTQIKGGAKILYCIFSGGEFKVGFKFASLDLSTVTALSRYLR